MRAQKQAQLQESSASPLKPSAPAAGTSRDEHPILSLQRTVGNQAVQRRLQIRQPLPATTLARDDPKPATPAKPTTPTDTELCKNPFTIDEKIRCELLKKPPETDAAATETWKQNLRDLFKSASPAQTAQDLHTRLTAKLDDAFTLYFREQFGLADRTEMLTLLAANFLPAPGTKPKAVTSETIGDKTAAAAGSFPPASSSVWRWGTTSRGTACCSTRNSGSSSTSRSSGSRRRCSARRRARPRSSPSCTTSSRRTRPGAPRTPRCGSG